MFCLFYDAKTKKVSALNGSGHAPGKSTLEQIRKDLGIPAGKSGKIPINSVHSVTVPGAAAGWVDTVERFGSGKLSMEEILSPAIEMGEKGFPVSEFSSTFVCMKFENRIHAELTLNSGEMVHPLFGRHLPILQRC